jgi:hypothetical protein
VLAHNAVVPFDQQHHLPLAARLTDNGSKFCGTPEHPDERYLARCETEHRRTKRAGPQTHSFSETVCR